MKIQALEVVEELITKRADKQVLWLLRHNLALLIVKCNAISSVWSHYFTSGLCHPLHVVNGFWWQSMLLLDAFNKDRASLPQPLTNLPSLAALPVVAPDARTQEMINEKLKKVEDLGMLFSETYWLLTYSGCIWNAEQFIYMLIDC